jgi:hypothetical protein
VADGLFLVVTHAPEIRELLGCKVAATEVILNDPFNRLGAAREFDVWQFFQYWVDRKARDANKKHAFAMKRSLQALRQMCAEAIDNGEVIKTEPVKQWVRQVAWTLVGIEGHIDALLELEQAKVERAQTRGLLEELNRWILSGNQLVEMVTTSPGVRNAAGEEPPSSELEQRVDEWIKEAGDFVVEKFPWFEGPFRSDAGLPPSDTLCGKNVKFTELRQRLERRLARLAELLKQFSPQ